MSQKRYKDAVHFYLDFGGCVQTKSEWNKWNSLSILSLSTKGLHLTELRNSDIVVEKLTTLVCDLFAVHAPMRHTASVRATYALTDKLHTSC